MSKVLLFGAIVFGGVICCALWQQKRKAKPSQTESNASKELHHPQPVHQVPTAKDKENRLFTEHLQAFEHDYLAYLLEKEALARDLPLAAMEDLAKQYGTSKGDPPYTPNLDLPVKGVSSERVTQLMDDWLATNDNHPSDEPPSFRVRRVIKARLDRKVTEICDKIAQSC